MSKGDDDKRGFNMSSRVFVANVPVDQTTPGKLKERFSKYGNVSDVFFGKSFAFVQFESASDADAAIQSESGTFIGENKIECSLAKKQPKFSRNDGPGGGPDHRGPPGGGGPPGGRGGGLQGRGFRDRSPMRPGYEDRFEGRLPPRDFRDDPYRDPYYRDLPEREMPYSAMDMQDRPPRPRRSILEEMDSLLPTPTAPPLSTDREVDMRIKELQKESEERRFLHDTKMRMMKEEHELKMEIFKLEKQAMELKVLKLMKSFNNSGDAKQIPPNQAQVQTQGLYQQAAMLSQAHQMSNAARYPTSAAAVNQAYNQNYAAYAMASKMNQQGAAQSYAQQQQQQQQQQHQQQQQQHQQQQQQQLPRQAMAAMNASQHPQQ